MSDLVEFLLARLDEDEQAARNATAGPWTHDPAKIWLDGEAFERFDRSKGEEFVGHGGPSPFRGCVASTGPGSDAQSMADAAFIGRHDPARVLLEVAAKRRIVAECRGNSRMELVGALSDLVLALLAEPYADHPDYRDEWRVLR